jgi:hypothetical protein
MEHEHKTKNISEALLTIASHIPINVMQLSYKYVSLFALDEQAAVGDLLLAASWSIRSAINCAAPNSSTQRMVHWKNRIWNGNRLRKLFLYTLQNNLWLLNLLLKSIGADKLL